MQALFTCSASRFAGQAPVAARRELPRLCPALLCISLVAKMNQTYQSAHSSWGLLCFPFALAAALALCTPLAWAQNAPAAPAGAASTPSKTSATERARRDADKVFQMILMHSDKARTPAKQPVTRDVAPGGAAAAAPTAAAARPAASPAQALARTTPAAAPSPTAAARPAASAGTAAAPTLLSSAPPAAVPEAAGREPLVSPPPASEPAPAPATSTTNATPALPAPAAAPTSTPPAANKLELLSSVEPDFPARLVRTLGSGKVVVQFEVAADGTVSQVDVVQSSHRGLDAAAVAAVKQWRFKPMSGSASGMTELRFE
jgi:TonB family protein